MDRGRSVMGKTLSMWYDTGGRDFVCDKLIIAAGGVAATGRIKKGGCFFMSLHQLTSKPGILLKWLSQLIRVAPTSCAVAAIQMSLVGIGVPV